MLDISRHIFAFTSQASDCFLFFGSPKGFQEFSNEKWDQGHCTRRLLQEHPLQGYVESGISNQVGSYVSKQAGSVGRNVCDLW
jgi:hypothetical protein